MDYEIESEEDLPPDQPAPPPMLARPQPQTYQIEEEKDLPAEPRSVRSALQSPAVQDTHRTLSSALMSGKHDADSPPVGRKEEGNVDPWNRKVLRNPDGSVSTTSSISIGTDKGEVLIPTVINGKRLTNEEAIAHYNKTGEQLGVFDNAKDADTYAESLHNAQASRLESQGVHGIPQQSALEKTEPSRGRYLPELPEVTVTGERPQDPGREMTWGELPSEVSANVGGRIENKIAGTEETAGFFKKRNARETMWQAMLLPGLVKDAADKGIALTEHPDVIAEAERLGIRPDQFTRDWPKYAGMTEEERQKVISDSVVKMQKAGDLELTGRKRREKVAEVGKLFAPNYGSQWSGKGLAFNSATSIMDLLFAAGVGAINPAAGLAGMGVEILPEYIAQGRNLGLPMEKAVTYGAWYTAAEVATELPMLEALKGTPAGKAMIKMVAGRYANALGGRLITDATLESAGEAITQALQIGIDKGYLNKDMTLKEALESIAYNGAVGGVMGVGAGITTEALGAGARKVTGREKELTDEEQIDQFRKDLEKTRKTQDAERVRRATADIKAPYFNAEPSPAQKPSASATQPPEPPAGGAAAAQEPALGPSVEKGGPEVSEEELAAEGPPEDDRRQNAERRKAVADMTPEEMKSELLTHELTGIPNRRAYDESEKKPVQVSVDVDSLKWVNDNAGHAAGDQMLSAVAQVLKEEAPDAYHLSGDEFAVQADDHKQADDAMARVQERLKGATLEFVHPDGHVVTLNGLGISFGKGADLHEADTQLQARKAQRTEEGQRSERGEPPPGANVRPVSEGLPAQEREGAAPQAGVTADLQAVKDGNASPEAIARLESSKLIHLNETGAPRLSQEGKRALAAAPVMMKDEVQTDRVPSSSRVKTGVSTGEKLTEGTVAGQKVSVNLSPTPEQRKSGNYTKGRVTFEGLPINVENFAGSKRAFTHPDGTPGTREMVHHYGEFADQPGADGDNVDVFVTSDKETGRAFIINQIDPATGKFDEVKVILGAEDLREASDAYNANYQKDWRGQGSIHEVSTARLKEWLAKPRSSRGEYKPSRPMWNRAGENPTLAQRIDTAITDPNSTSHIILGVAPASLVAVGIPNLHTVLPRQTPAKMVYEHGLTKSQIFSLNDYLTSPTMIFKSATVGDGNYIIVTQDTVADGPLMIALRANGSFGQHKLNVVTSAYGRKGPQVLGKWLTDGLLLASTPELAVKWLDAYGINTPGNRAIINAAPRVQVPPPRRPVFSKETASTPVQNMMDEFYQTTLAHPFMPSARLVGEGKPRTEGDKTSSDYAIVEMSPWDRGVHISSIQSMEMGEKRGVGSRALKFITNLADKFGVKLYLHPSKFGKGKNLPTTAQLKKWYGRNGFRTLRGSDQMIRLATKARALLSKRGKRFRQRQFDYGRYADLFPKRGDRPIKPKVTPPGVRTKAEVVRGMVADLVHPMTAADVVVVESEADLPEHVITALMTYKQTNAGVRGMLWPDTGVVYIMADKLQTQKDAFEVVYHELVGHYGLRSFLGSRAIYEDVMEGVWRDMPDLARQYGYQNGLNMVADENGNTKLMTWAEVKEKAPEQWYAAAEEVFAYTAGQVAAGRKIDPRIMPWWKKLIASIKNYFAGLRGQTFYGKDNIATEAAIARIIENAANHLKREARSMNNELLGKPVFAMKPKLYYSKIWEAINSPKVPQVMPLKEFGNILKSKINKEYGQEEWNWTGIEPLFLNRESTSWGDIFDQFPSTTYADNLTSAVRYGAPEPVIAALTKLTEIEKAAGIYETEEELTKSEQDKSALRQQLEDHQVGRINKEYVLDVINAQQISISVIPAHSTIENQDEINRVMRDREQAMFPHHRTYYEDLTSKGENDDEETDAMREAREAKEEEYQSELNDLRTSLEAETDNYVEQWDHIHESARENVDDDEIRNSLDDVYREMDDDDFTSYLAELKDEEVAFGREDFNSTEAFENFERGFKDEDGDSVDVTWSDISNAGEATIRSAEESREGSPWDKAKDKAIEGRVESEAEYYHGGEGSLWEWSERPNIGGEHWDVEMRGSGDYGWTGSVDSNHLEGRSKDDMIDKILDYIAERTGPEEPDNQKEISFDRAVELGLAKQPMTEEEAAKAFPLPEEIRTEEPQHPTYQVKGGKDYKERTFIWDNAERHGFKYTGGHWHTPNALMHVRWNIRKLADGSTVMFIEEVQADWLQSVRDQLRDNRVAWKKINKQLDVAKSIVAYMNGTAEYAKDSEGGNISTFMQGKGTPNKVIREQVFDKLLSDDPKLFRLQMYAIAKETGSSARRGGMSTYDAQDIQSKQELYQFLEIKDAEFSAMLEDPVSSTVDPDLMMRKLPTLAFAQIAANYADLTAMGYSSAYSVGSQLQVLFDEPYRMVIGALRPELMNFETPMQREVYAAFQAQMKPLVDVFDQFLFDKSGTFGRGLALTIGTKMQELRRSAEWNAIKAAAEQVLLSGATKPIFSIRNDELVGEISFLNSMVDDSTGNLANAIARQKRFDKIQKPPLLKTWYNTVLKWAITECAEKGHDGIAFAPGAVQGIRWSATKRYGGVEIIPLPEKLQEDTEKTREEISERTKWGVPISIDPKLVDDAQKYGEVPDTPLVALRYHRTPITNNAEPQIPTIGPFGRLGVEAGNQSIEMIFVTTADRAEGMVGRVAAAEFVPNLKMEKNKVVGFNDPEKITVANSQGEQVVWGPNSADSGVVTRHFGHMENYDKIQLNEYNSFLKKYGAKIEPKDMSVTGFAPEAVGLYPGSGKGQTVSESDAVKTEARKKFGVAKGSELLGIGQPDDIAAQTRQAANMLRNWPGEAQIDPESYYVYHIWNTERGTGFFYGLSHSRRHNAEVDLEDNLQEFLNSRAHRDLVKKELPEVSGAVADVARVNTVMMNEKLTTTAKTTSFPLFMKSQTQGNANLGNAVVMGSNTFDMPEPSLTSRSWNYLRFKVQDKYIDLLNTQAAVDRWRGSVGIPEKMDAYLANTLYHGRAEERIKDYEKDFEDPLIEMIKRSGYEWEAVSNYLYARHAPERNARMAAINPNDPTFGSGMTDAEAAQVMTDLAQLGDIRKLEAIGVAVDAINKWTRDTMVMEGLESPETVAAWEAQYQHYVPLKGWAVESESLEHPGMPKKGKGYDTGGKLVKQATGRKTRAAQILANIGAQARSTLVLAEKAKVGRALYDFVSATPAPDLWTVDKVEYTRTIDKSSGLVVERVNPQYKLADNVVRVKIDGTDYHITFNDQNPMMLRLAHAMKNLNPDQVGPIFGFLHGINRYLSTISTSLNPEFVVTNALRDLQTALLNLTEEDQKGLRTEVVTNWRKAWWGIRRGEHGKSAAWAGEWERFKKAGAKVGWIDNYKNPKDLEKYMQKKLGPNGTVQWTMDGIRKVGEFINNENTAVENAVRLSVFVALTGRGVSEAKAASVAKNLTVNFNRRGDIGVLMNSLYLFANASVQGTARLAQLATTRKGRMVLFGVIGAGIVSSLLNRFLGGLDDDDENKYDKIPQHVKERNIIVMLPPDMAGKFPGTDTQVDYIKVPMPYGYNVPFYIGTILGNYVDFFSRDNIRQIDPGADAANIGSAMMGAFSPLGDVSSSFAQFISPTFLDPFVQIDENRSWSGGKLYPDTAFDESPPPDSGQSFASTPQGYKNLTQWLNHVTGGTEVTPGHIDISPETLQLWVDTAGGGLAQFMSGFVSAPVKFLQDPQALEVREIPFLRRVVGNIGDREDQEVFYGHIKEVQYAKSEIDAVYKMGINTPEGQEKLAFISKKYPVAALLAREAYPSFTEGHSDEDLDKRSILKKLYAGIEPDKPFTTPAKARRGETGSLITKLTRARQEIRRLEMRDGMPAAEKKQLIEDQRELIRKTVVDFNKKWNEVHDTVYGARKGRIIGQLGPLLDGKQRREQVATLRTAGYKATADLLASLPPTPDRRALEYYQLDASRA